MGVLNFSVIPIPDDDDDTHSPSSSISCHNMMEKGLKSSHLLVKEMNKKKDRISKSKATTGVAAASMKFCLCAPTTHPGSFKCRLHRATASSHTRTVLASASNKVCLCAPSTHPGSFKCCLHRATASHTRSVSSSVHHICGVKYVKTLNPFAPSQSGGIRCCNQGKVRRKPKLSRFGRAALAHATSAAATSSVQIQPISAAFGQMSLS